jgi:hypothetical protein
MTQQLLGICLALTLVVCAIGAASQTATDNRLAKPALHMKMIPSKAAYAPKESVTAKTILTNLSDKRLCFPKPEQGRHIAVQGYFEIQVVAPPGAPDVEQFIEVVDARVPWPREKLLSDINERWIKLWPKETYTTEAARVPARFDTPGQWLIKETYRPPEDSVANWYREALKSAALSTNCTLPDSPVSAEDVTINVVSPPEKN